MRASVTLTPPPPHLASHPTWLISAAHSEARGFFGGAFGHLRWRRVAATVLKDKMVTGRQRMVPSYMLVCAFVSVCPHLPRRYTALTGDAFH